MRIRLSILDLVLGVLILAGVLLLLFTPARRSVVRSDIRSVELVVVGWKMDTTVTASPTTTIRRLAEAQPVDVFCFTGVEPSVFENLRRAANEAPGVKSIPDRAYRTIESNNGGNAGIQLLFNPNKLEVREACRLSDFPGCGENQNENPCPLIAKFKIKDSHQTVSVAVVTFVADEAESVLQATALRQWAMSQSRQTGIIIVADFDRGFNFSTKTGSKAFDALGLDGILKWVPPFEFVETDWIDRNPVDGKNDVENWISMGVFVAGESIMWPPPPISDVLVDASDFTAESLTSRHRLLRTEINVRQ